MNYSTSAYADSRIDELHRTGAEERRAAARAAHPRVGLVIALMRKREAERSVQGAPRPLTGRASPAR